MRTGNCGGHLDINYSIKNIFPVILIMSYNKWCVYIIGADWTLCVCGLH